MKSILPIIVVLISLNFSQAQSINTSNISTVDSNAYVFMDMPLQQHNSKVQFYFNGEKPNQSFYKIRIVEVTGGNSYQDLLDILQTKAQSEGYDGMIILGKSDYLYSDNTTGGAVTQGLIIGTVNTIAGNNRNNNTYMQNVYAGQKLSAIGIKFKSKMQYINTIAKQASITLNDSAKTTMTIQFNWKKDVVSSGKNAIYYWQNIGAYTLADAFAINNSKLNFYNDNALGLTVSEKIPTGLGMIKYKANYFADSTIEHIQIKQTNSDENIDTKFYDVKYSIANGAINKRFLWSQGRKAATVFTDVYQYDNDKKCIGFTRLNSTTNEAVFTVRYSFFSENDLP